MCDFNIDFNTTGVEINKMYITCNLFDLTNSIITETGCTESHKSTTDLFLLNKPLSFKKSSATEKLSLS